MNRSQLKWDVAGLIPAVVQDGRSGEVLMVAWMNDEALEMTLRGPHVTFWSRSRSELWTKGATSGAVQAVRAVRVDCDGDTLLVTVDPAGPACHTGAQTCFFEDLSHDEAAPRIGAVLGQLAATIEARKDADPEQSWTAKLLSGGAAAYGVKIIEEADEVVKACAEESPERVAEEAADLLYHLLVGMAARGVGLSDVASVLRSRQGISGVTAKALRADNRDSP